MANNIEKNLEVAKKAINGLFKEDVDMYEGEDSLVFQMAVTIPGGQKPDGEGVCDVAVTVKDLFIATYARFELPKLVKNEKDELELIKFLNYLNGEDGGRALLYFDETVSITHKIFTPNDEVASVEVVMHSLISCITPIEDYIAAFIIVGGGLMPAGDAIAIIKNVREKEKLEEKKLEEEKSEAEKSEDSEPPQNFFQKLLKSLPF